MNTDQPISGVTAAAAVAVLVPGVARVELLPQVSDGSGTTVFRTRAVPVDGEGCDIEVSPEVRRAVSAVLLPLEFDRVRPQVLDIAVGSLAPMYGPPAPEVLPLSEAPVAEAAHLLACQLAEQQHQSQDPAEPPLAVAVVEPAGGAA